MHREINMNIKILLSKQVKVKIKNLEYKNFFLSVKDPLGHVYVMLTIYFIFGRRYCGKKTRKSFSKDKLCWHICVILQTRCIFWMRRGGTAMREYCVIDVEKLNAGFMSEHPALPQ